MTIVSSSLGQSLIVLYGLAHVLRAVLLNVMMGSDWMLELIVNNLTRSLAASST